MPWRKVKFQQTYRDVCVLLQYLREFLLGRKHNLHGRFTPFISPRSIPPADVPRGPEYKYSNQYYLNRHYMDSNAPPVVAPVAEGPPIGHPKTKKAVSGGLKPDSLRFHRPPTPGPTWWWDGHFYYDYVQDHTKTPRCPPSNFSPSCPEPTPPQSPRPSNCPPPAATWTPPRY